MKDNQSREELDNEEQILDENSEESSENDGINNFIQKNGKMIVICSAAVIVLVGLIMMFRANSQKNEIEAAKALSRIETYYLQGEYEIALYGNDTLPLVRGEKIVGLVAIVKDYGSTSAGQRAALFAADSYYILNNFPNAKKYYDKSAKSNIDVVRVGGLAGVAACNEREGNLKDAADAYTKAAELIQDDGLKLRYMYFAGLCYEKVGNADLARVAYRNIINLNKFGEFNNLAKAGIVRLGENIE